MMEEWWELINKWRLLALATVMFSLVVGCGPTKEPTGTITGHVTYNGEPVENCKVDVYDSVERRSFAASTDAQGAYEVIEVRFADYQVAVYQATDPHSAEETPFDPRIPLKYRDFETSEITVSIGAAEAVVLDIDMK